VSVPIPPTASHSSLISCYIVSILRVSLNIQLEVTLMKNKISSNTYIHYISLTGIMLAIVCNRKECIRLSSLQKFFDIKYVTTEMFNKNKLTQLLSAHMFTQTGADCRYFTNTLIESGGTR
jgi:hypothetical protein